MQPNSFIRSLRKCQTIHLLIVSEFFFNISFNCVIEILFEMDSSDGSISFPISHNHTNFTLATPPIGGMFSIYVGGAIQLCIKNGLRPRFNRIRSSFDRLIHSVIHLALIALLFTTVTSFAQNTQIRIILFIQISPLAFHNGVCSKHTSKTI